jgi:hypothetical protein
MARSAGRHDRRDDKGRCLQVFPALGQTLRSIAWRDLAREGVEFRGTVGEAVI